MNSSQRNALVVGASGVAGQALCRELLAAGWSVSGVSSSRALQISGLQTLRVDLSDPDQTQAALNECRPDVVFLSVWRRMPTEKENIEVNSAIIRNTLSALSRKNSIRHVALLTGLKHYLGPFESYGQGATRETPFHEYEQRLDAPNFYYAQEDELWRFSRDLGFSWSVHRAHTIIGFAVGNAMNMGVTLAVQAALCRELNIPFKFPGSEVQWRGLTDMTDAGLLARQMIWSACTPGLPSQAYNVANGDVFRWEWMWLRLAKLLGVDAEGYLDAPRPLEAQMTGMDSVWRKIAQREGLVEPSLDRLASWWHTDADMGRTIECFTDLATSRRWGFMESVVTLDAFERLFSRLRVERVIPDV